MVSKLIAKITIVETATAEFAERSAHSVPLLLL